MPAAAAPLAVTMSLLAVVAQDHVPLRASATDNTTAHAQLWQGELLEVRGSRPGQWEVYDHRLERGGYVRESEARLIGTGEADAPQLLAVLRFLRDKPGAESLGIAYAAAYLKAAPADAITAEPFDALGTMAERLARGASLRQGRADALSAHMEVAGEYGVKFISTTRSDGAHGDTMQLCYDGEAFRHVLAMAGDTGGKKASPEQRARAVLALTRYDCLDPALSPAARKAMDQQRADLLDTVDHDNKSSDKSPLEDSLRNRLRLRRAGAWAAVAFDKSRFQEAPEAAAQRAMDEFALVDKAQLGDEERSEYAEAAIRVGAVHWAALKSIASPQRLQVQTQAGQPGQTCARLVDSWAKTPTTLAERCTFGTVWPSSVRASPEGRAVALTVQPLDGWSELWLWHQEPDGWKVDVLPPDAHGPGLGYIEWAGWSPAARGKLLVAREVKTEGRVTRRFEVVRIDTLATEKSANDPHQLAAFNLWADASWRQDTISIR